MQSHNKNSFSFLDFDPNMELIVNHFTELNALGNQNLNFHTFLDFSSPLEFPGNLAENFPGIFHDIDNNVLPAAEPVVVSGVNDFHESKKRKAMDVSESSSGNSCPPLITPKNSSRRGKRTRGDEKEEKKQKEVVHVRARRGQATGSHSLAERVRREKINDRMKCLQDIVPGCYKTMGMAVMLDEIINYVQSLQNQVEFLSMKLTAASAIYDFNSETDDMEAMQRAKAYEAEKVVKKGCEGLASTQLGPFDLTFGSYSSLPFNT
ncbi:unnamed protein product [Camellia sinensis]